MSATLDMPRWNLDILYSSVESDEYLQACQKISEKINQAEKRFAEIGIGSPNPSEGTPTEIEETVRTMNELSLELHLVVNYPQLKLTTDSDDEASQAAFNNLQPVRTKLNKLETAWTAWIGVQDIDKAVVEKTYLADHAFPLKKLQIVASKQMSKAEEELTSDLDETGASAWSKFFFDYSSKIEVPFRGEMIPMSAARAQAYDADASIRKDAYEAELGTWSKHETACAAAMNNIKGWHNKLAEKRNWGSQLNQTLFACNMDQGCLEAMMLAAKKSFPDFRRYLKAKAKLLGHSGSLPFYDIFAPVGEDADWSWDKACDFVEEGFRSYSDKMGYFARMSYEENWHDAPPAKGKRDGAFCSSYRPGESRMLHNFKPAFGSVSTLAHELGHAYHNLCLQNREPYQKRTPMTLAETASIFCETIIKKKALKETSGQQKLAILEASLQGANQVVVDISSRYQFETNVIAKRQERAISATEMCEMMREAQLATYGDGLDENALHPYMWAVKPHYYGYMAFYNFPYMFGLLFALGLYNIYENEPEGFHDKYDDLLSSTGLCPAAELTQRFGIDITTEDFWAGSLAVVKSDIDEFCSLVE